MEILTYILKWSEVILRWGHVLFAILWVGNSFLFNYLDNKLNKEVKSEDIDGEGYLICLLYTSPSPRDRTRSRMPSSA